MYIMPLIVYFVKVYSFEQVYQIIQTLLTYSFFFGFFPCCYWLIHRLFLIHPCS